MKHSLLAVTLLAVTCPAFGQASEVTETIPLRYIAAQTVPNTVKALHGAEICTLNLRENSVTVRGTSQALAAFKTELKAADVQPIAYKVAMRLIRCQIDAQGKRTDTVLLSPTILDLAGETATISVQNDSGYAINLIPHRANANTVLLEVEVREIGKDGEVVRSGKSTRQVRLGDTVQVTGMTDADDPRIRQAVHKGEVITNRGAYTAYYVQATPTIQPPPASK